MGKRSKQKGARGEREVVRMLNPIVERVALRNNVLPDTVKRTSHMAANSGGDDLHGIEWASIEVKRHEKIVPSKMRAWWAQTCGQATNGRLPILLYRKNNEPWRARVRICEHVLIMTEDEFLEWFERAHELWLTDRLSYA